ncbi:MAG: hypothetical protein ABI367_15200 [Mucilaginibacter sp.]
MKKVLFLFMLIVVASKIKAQSLQTQTFNNVLIHSVDTLPGDYFSKMYFNRTSDSLKKAHYPLHLFTDSEKSRLFLNQYAYDCMPIAKLSGYSKMPIIKPNINSKMPILYLDDPNKRLKLKTGLKP